MVPLHPPASRKHFTARTLQYQRAFGVDTSHASLDLFLGTLGALGRDQGGAWHGTSAKPEFGKALRERHVCKTLNAQRGAKPHVTRKGVLDTFYSSGGSPSEGHNPLRGSPRKFASQRVLESLCGALFEGSAGSPRGSAGVCGGPPDFPRVVALSLSPWGTVEPSPR